MVQATSWVVEIFEVVEETLAEEETLVEEVIMEAVETTMTLVTTVDSSSPITVP